MKSKASLWWSAAAVVLLALYLSWQSLLLHAMQRWLASEGWALKIWRQPGFGPGLFSLDRLELRRAGAGDSELVIELEQVRAGISWHRRSIDRVDIGRMRVRWQQGGSPEPWLWPDLPAVRLPVTEVGIARLELDLSLADGQRWQQVTPMKLLQTAAGLHELEFMLLDQSVSLRLESGMPSRIELRWPAGSDRERSSLYVTYAKTSAKKKVLTATIPEQIKRKLLRIPLSATGSVALDLTLELGRHAGDWSRLSGLIEADRLVLQQHEASNLRLQLQGKAQIGGNGPVSCRPPGPEPDQAAASVAHVVRHQPGSAANPVAAWSRSSSISMDCSCHRISLGKGEQLASGCLTTSAPGWISGPDTGSQAAAPSSSSDMMANWSGSRTGWRWCQPRCARSSFRLEPALADWPDSIVQGVTNCPVRRAGSRSRRAGWVGRSLSCPASGSGSSLTSLPHARGSCRCRPISSSSAHRFSWQLRGSRDRLELRHLSTGLLGGNVTAALSRLSWPLKSGTIPLRIEGLELGQLLRLIDLPGLQGSGRLSGLLPLSWDGRGAEIRDGELQSSGEGRISYQSMAPVGGNVGLQALRDFRYQNLAAGLDYLADGRYRLRLRLEGHNPELYQGHPIDFNLNIKGELPGLLQGALLACSPTVKLQAPDKPIEINMTVSIKHEILLKVEKEVQQMFQADQGLF